MNEWGQIMAAMLLVCVGAAGASGAAENVRHPVTRFWGDGKELRNAVKPIAGKNMTQLRQLFEGEKRDYQMRAKSYEGAARAAVSLWTMTRDRQFRDVAVKAYGAALGALVNASDADLVRQVSEKGSIDPRNFRARDACEHFAMLYHLTRQKRYAHRSAVLLARFADQIPKWPIYFPRYVKTPHGKGSTIENTYPQEGPKFYKGWDAPGFWGAWIYEDILLGIPLARAYDLIYRSGEMQKLGALSAIESMLRRHVELQKRWGTNGFSNMDGAQIRGILAFAKLLGEPEWVHECVRWIKAIYKTNFYADGWWHEGTPSYHKQIHHGLQNICKSLLQGYSDPPGFKSDLDGTRYDKLDIMKMLARQFGRAKDVLNGAIQPNGICQVIHDTSFPQSAWWTPRMKEAKSILFGCTGHGILGTGRGKNMVQATLHFGGTHGHEHFDCLNIILFAKGRELISETRYRPQAGTNSTREWQTSTAGHVTVVVDGKDQTGRGSLDTPKRTRQSEDAIPGIPDWTWRWMGHGNAMNDGKLRLFNTDFEWVQVAEADGERAYGSLVEMKLYRRTIALVKISETDCYLVDIFRVRGGKVHDYMLHSCLDFPHKLSVSTPLNGKLSGELHKYIGDLRSGKADGAWIATFALEDGSASLKSFFLPQAGTEVIRGSAPAMRRLGAAPFIAVRQSDGDSVFAAVHHPYVGEPLIQSVERIELTTAGGEAVALRVTLPGRVDTIISTADEEPWKARRTKDGHVTFRGRFAHVAEGGPGNSWLYLVDGEELRVGDVALEGKVSHDGVLDKTYRVEAGDEFDAFETSTPLPTNGSLNGRTLMVDIGGLLVQSFRIKEIERRGNRTLIHSLDEPGMTITPNLVKLEYYPCWGIKGNAKFRIAGSALLRKSPKGEWKLTATVPVKASIDQNPLLRFPALAELEPIGLKLLRPRHAKHRHVRSDE